MHKTRVCKVCTVRKPIEQFHVYGKKGMRRYRCDKCRNAGYRADYRRRKAEDPNWYPRTLKQKQANEKRYLKRMRDAAIEAYGGYQCACCGETEPRFMTLDHVNNDGKKQRKIHGTGMSMYQWLKKNNYPKGLQVLCMNCNFGKALNGGICPHQEGSTTRRKP